MRMITRVLLAFIRARVADARAHAANFLKESRIMRLQPEGEHTHIGAIHAKRAAAQRLTIVDTNRHAILASRSACHEHLHAFCIHFAHTGYLSMQCNNYSSNNLFTFTACNI